MRLINWHLSTPLSFDQNLNRTNLPLISGLPPAPVERQFRAKK